MVDKVQEGYGLNSPDVLSAMLQVPREVFVPTKAKRLAYDDRPVNIGFGQTISQPYTVAFMTDLLGLKGRERVLEIGTGSGYQAAILSKLAGEIYTVEIIPKLAKRARKTFKKLKYSNIHARSGSGEFGWPEHAPYEAIIVTAGMEGEPPQALFNQLATGGVLVVPIGSDENKVMTKYVKESGLKFKKTEHGIFRFVPFVKE